MTTNLAHLERPVCDCCTTPAGWLVRIRGHTTRILCGPHATAAARFNLRDCDCCGRTLRIRMRRIDAP